MRDGKINFISFVIDMEGKLFFVQFMKWGVSYWFFFGFVVYYFIEGGDLYLFILIFFVEYGIYRSYLKKIQNEVKKDFLLGWKIFEVECFKWMCFSDVFSVDFVLCVEVDDVLSVCWEIDGMYKVGVYIIDVSFFVVKNFNLDKVVFLYGIFVYGSFEVFYYNVMLFFYVSIELCSLFFDEE